MNRASIQLQQHAADFVQEPLLEWERDAALEAWLMVRWGKKGEFMYINPLIEITEGEGVGEQMHLRDFLLLNEIEESDAYADDIRAALFDCDTFVGGGGAAPVWSIRTVKTRPSTGGDSLHARLECDRLSHEDDIAEYMSHSDADPGL